MSDGEHLPEFALQDLDRRIWTRANLSRRSA
jgi:hypothetical protein